MVKKIVFLTTTGAGKWTVPDDFSQVNTIHCIGGGGGGGEGGSDGAAGGGGGAYSAKFNVSLSPRQVVDYFVGVGGLKEQNAQSTWFGATAYGNALCAAEGGFNPPGGGSANKTGGDGGRAFVGIGDIKYSGGRGGDASSGNNGGGGGGAAGPDGNGNTPTQRPLGGDAAGGTGTGGREGTPATMLELWTQTLDGAKAGPGGGGFAGQPAAPYGGGGGGEHFGFDGQRGAQGIIVIEYEAAEHNTRCWIVG